MAKRLFAGLIAAQESIYENPLVGGPQVPLENAIYVRPIEATTSLGQKLGGVEGEEGFVPTLHGGAELNAGIAQEATPQQHKRNPQDPSGQHHPAPGEGDGVITTTLKVIGNILSGGNAFEDIAADVANSVRIENQADKPASAALHNAITERMQEEPTAQSRQAQFAELMAADDEDEAPTGGGLNAGFELDGEEPYEAPFVAQDIPGAPEPLDIKSEAEQIVALESQLIDLHYLLHDLKQSKGMNRGFALEAEKLLPGFGGGVPAGYYTEAPSATRYKVSLEEISKGVWGMIAAGITALLVIIAKIYSYFSGKKTGEEGDESSAVSDIETKIKVAEADVSALDETASIVESADRLLAHANIVLKNEHGHEYQCDSFQAIINHVFTNDERYGRAKKFLNSRDPVLHDIIHNGDYSKAAALIGGRLSSANTAIIAKMDLIDQVIRSDLGSSSTSAEMKNTRMLEQASQPLEFVVNGRTMTLSETADYLRTIRSEMADKNVNNPITFDRLFTTMADAYRSRAVERILGQLGESLSAAGNMQKRLERMQSITRNLSTDGTPGASTQGVGQHLREVIFGMAKDVSGLAMLSSEINFYAANLEHLAKEALGFAVEVVRKTSSEMKKNKQEVPAGWQKVVDDLNLQQKAITGAYYGRR